MISRAVDPLPRTSSRIILRRLRVDDLPAFQAYRADPEVGRFQGWSPMPIPAATAFLAGMSTALFGVAGEWFQLGIAEPATDRLIGDIGFCVCGPENEHAEVGFSLARDCQGRGLATEAVGTMVEVLFECTKIERVVAMTDERNLSSIRLLQRVGMKRVGQVNSVFRGEQCVELIYVRHRGA